MTRWQGQPAIGALLGKIVELHARLVRIDAEKRRQGIEQVRALAEKVIK